jgi:hypothetical protein
MPINSHSFYDTAIRDSLACWIEVKSAGHVQHPVFFRQELGENRRAGASGGPSREARDKSSQNADTFASHKAKARQSNGLAAMRNRALAVA